MSVQFGKCNFDGKPIDPRELDQVRPILAPYGPDAEGRLCKDNFGVLYRAFHTTKESRNEVQPYVSASGAVITWDGRLDNREELIRQLGNDLSAASTDLAIVAKVYEHWRDNFFPRLIGDWALSLWDPQTQHLLLAKDFVNTRHIYYSVTPNQVTWSTVLSPLVLFAGHKLLLDEEYLAGWLTSLPDPHLSPYVGIRSVPASCFVQITPRAQKVCRYWDFDSRKTVQYRKDEDYEEHFRDVFAQSVRRRLRSDCPVLAELSGGMDSSSIVCVADRILCNGTALTPRIDTLSYYDDCEPNWNERPYFTQVEAGRGRAGNSIQLNWQEPLFSDSDRERFLPTPADQASPTEADQQFARCIASQGDRVVLSGTGGDEFLGGVPTPIPELADLLARARFRQFIRKLKLWALDRRKPWIHLVFAAISEFVPSALRRPPKKSRPPLWLTRDYIRLHRTALVRREPRLSFFGPLPSFQDSLNTLDDLRRQLESVPLPSEPSYEKRYPYLDRDLLEFLYAIPREQLVRPGQRRSLMRRSLAGFVPEAILQRKRKAYVSRGPRVALAANWLQFTALTHEMLTEALGIVDAATLVNAAQDACTGKEVPVTSIMRTLRVELWLRNVLHQVTGNSTLVVWPTDFAQTQCSRHEHWSSAS
jgi:asparagine synthase (glutamine-hydrolysing)